MDCYRWNFDVSATALLVCRNNHDKGDKCDMQPMHPAEILSLVNDLRARVLNAEAKEAAAVAAERERLLETLLSMPNLMHTCDALGVPATSEYCDLLRRALHRA